MVGIPQNIARGQQDIVGKSRKRQSGVKVVLKRLVNLVEVATKFCVAYTQSSSKIRSRAVLRSNVDALRGIRSLSCLLRLLVRKIMALNLDSRGRLRRTATDLSNIMVGYFALESQIFSKSVVRRILIGRELRLTEK